MISKQTLRKGIVHLWRHYFADLATENPESQNTKDIDIEKLSAESYSQTEPILSHQVTCDEIVSVIKSLKNIKAPGPDCISNEHLKYAGNSFINHIQIVFYFIVKYEYIPKSYRTGCII